MERDPRWNAYPLIPKEPERFLEVFRNEYYLKPEVDEDIRQQFNVIIRLVEFSYYEYEFFDVASNLALSVIEMALRIWYKKQTGTQWGKRPLQQLLKCASDNEYFEADSELYLNWLRESRNIITHREQYYYQGAFMNTYIHTMLDLTNDLYEDVDKRRERKRLLASYNRVFDTIRPKGILIRYDGVLQYVAYHIRNGFVDNKSEPTLVTFLAKPLFKTPPVYQPGESYLILPFEEIALNNVEIINDQTIHGTNKDDKTVEITCCSEPEELENFKQWKEGYDRYNIGGWYDHSSDRPMAGYASQLRSQFHRKNN